MIDIFAETRNELRIGAYLYNNNYFKGKLRCPSSSTIKSISKILPKDLCEDCWLC